MPYADSVAPNQPIHPNLIIELHVYTVYIVCMWHFINVICSRCRVNVYISEKDVICLDSKGNRVLFMSSEADLADKDDDQLFLRRTVLKKYVC